MRLIRVQHLSTISQASIGLLRAKKAYPVYFKTRFGIHTFGMKFPIDVLILGENFEVVRLKSELVPNRIFLWPLRYVHVVELPSGFIRKQSVLIGDRIDLLFV
jgi:hypothetical protein